MRARKWAVRLVRLAGALALFIVLLTFAAVQLQQWTLRRHAEQLSADMHAIRLYQTTWSDAQRLIRRWGAWGYYDGACTPASCTYNIQMASAVINNPQHQNPAWLVWLLTHDRLNLYSWFGGRGSDFFASFTVHDGTIWRESTSIGLTVPTRGRRRAGEFDRDLSIGAVSRQRLQTSLVNWTDFMGYDPVPAQHPFYKVGRPSGCEINCEIGVVYFSTHTPPAEIERLTAYNFACFTRLHPCTELEDLLPAAQEWHLYNARQDPQQDLQPEKPCDVPLWALARDARYVLVVKPLSAKIVQDGDYRHELAKVQVLSSLKEPAPWLPGSIVRAHPFVRDRKGVPFGEPEHPLPGHQYIVFAIGNDRRDQIVTRDSPIKSDRCGVHEDTPEIRRELERGFAQNDPLTP